MHTMLNIHPSMRPFLASFAPPPPADPVQAARAEHWAAVNQAEACDPNVLRALRDQQQSEHNRGALA